jgi:hypothetical protein
MTASKPTTEQRTADIRWCITKSEKDEHGVLTSIYLRISHI